MKKLLALLSISCFAYSAIASTLEPTVVTTSADTKIKLEGFLGFQAGYSNQNKLKSSEKLLSDNKKKMAFYTEAAFFATISQEFNDVTAGAKLVLQPTTKPKTSTGYNGSHIFLETRHGKIEAGSPYDAGAKMRVTGYSIIAATGTNWSKYIKLDGGNMKYNNQKPDFDSCDSFYMEDFTNRFDHSHDKTEAARKISYYTSKMEGFQAGISYTPDTANTGGNLDINTNSGPFGFSKSKTGITVVKLQENGIATKTFRINQNVKDGISAAISYEHQLTDEFAVKVAVSGEYGKASRKMVEMDPEETKILAEYKLSDLKAYNLGAILTYGNFSCAASYGSLGKSLTSKEYHKVGRDTRYYNGAIAYGQGPIKTSLSYFKSSRYKNTVDTVSLGTEYKITPGLLPYAEIAYVTVKGKPVYYTEAPNKKTRGTVALLGAKLKF